MSARREARAGLLAGSDAPAPGRGRGAVSSSSVRGRLIAWHEARAERVRWAPGAAWHLARVELLAAGGPVVVPGWHLPGRDPWARFVLTGPDTLAPYARPESGRPAGP